MFQAELPGRAWPLYVALALAAGITIHSQSKHQSRLPPGPSFPSILWGMNEEQPWLSFTAWATIYGKLFHFYFLNQNIVTLNTEDAARALLEQRSMNYSDRPLDPRIRELHGLNFSAAFLPYGDEWRHHRKVFHQAFRSTATHSYWPIQLRKAHALLENLLRAPEDLFEHISTFAASTIMSVVYGYEASSTGDPFVTTVEKAMHVLTTTLSPARGLMLLAFPFIINIPTWLPGGSFQRRALECKGLQRRMRETPFQYVQDALALGTAIPSVSSEAMKGIDPEGDASQIETIKSVAASAYAGGAETTSTSLEIFFLAMVLFPEAQRRAQAEIDAIVGVDRLPTFEDRSSMPFIEATLRETLRWHPVAPLGVAHQAREADSFEGYRIPKGATVFPNVWAMTQDNKRYPDSDKFKPERFLNTDGTLNNDTVSYVFGFGRRICPGRHFADASLWSAIVSVLAVFNIEKPESGFSEPKWISGATSRPAPFPCRITPRVPGTDAERLEALIACAA
ncbi:hypothetical protein HYDPIDRAFT_108480 [Hydnomerulius pinastri MD-312]|nr:hypothetical protein HYDPIDRAFT_108480 [Hydnomerulius pinastri MD-312]